MAITKKLTKKKPIKAKKKSTKSISSSSQVLSPPIMTKQDRIWQAQRDARTLAGAEDVKKDKSRLKAAQFQAGRMAREQEIELQSIKKIAKK